ncbi:Isoprenylcysteine alpha-carbonyl methylesterase ICME [Sesamum angolense]|uniref:protein-S-isoprenylcysteine alpha-carbonyl methylesterase n=1 Tax=Sesamum angolense TaxID=2727404 RepID=A0AAE1WHT6_9LAMI|nr:Isoprenylcysteine alpha-carbonyl methylesterase ICME [Sesamum angolense]
METSSSLPANLLSRDSINEITEEMETDALVRMSSCPTAPALNQQRRRRVGNRSPSLAKRPCRQQSFSREIGHAAAETYLLTRLSFKLLSYLGVGYRWITRLLALALYAMLLMPGFLQVAFHYFFSSQVRRSVVYGDQPRNRLDLYLPTNIDDLKPVVIFITGGAWIIGNFPQGTISDMVADVCQGIAYICNNIIEFGGDPNKIYLMGQSAGAHISACALLQQAVKESRGDNISWSVSQIKAYFGLSGGYNLLKLVDHFHGRGLYRSIFLSIMEGEKALEEFSPELIIQHPSTSDAVSLLPRIILFHGTADDSIPCDASKTFVDALRGVGAQADLILYDGKTHTDLFLQSCMSINNTASTLASDPNVCVKTQDPLRGGKDELFDYLVAFIHADDKKALARDAMAPPRKRFVPEILAKLAGQVSPF